MSFYRRRSGLLWATFSSLPSGGHDEGLMNRRIPADWVRENKQPPHRRFTSRPYSTKSTASRASFTNPSDWLKMEKTSGSSPRSSRGPTLGPYVPVAGSTAPDTTARAARGSSSSSPSGTSPFHFPTPCAGSIAPIAASRSRPFLGHRASIPVAMPTVISSPPGPGA